MCGTCHSFRTSKKAKKQQGKWSLEAWKCARLREREEQKSADPIRSVANAQKITEYEHELFNRSTYSAKSGSNSLWTTETTTNKLGQFCFLLLMDGERRARKARTSAWSEIWLWWFICSTLNVRVEVWLLWTQEWCSAAAAGGGLLLTEK